MQKLGESESMVGGEEWDAWAAEFQHDKYQRESSAEALTSDTETNMTEEIEKG